MKAGSLVESAAAEIKVEASEEMVDILLQALRPEAERPSSARSRVSMDSEGRRLTIRVDASDVAALRAALNSYLRWANAVLDVVERVD